MTSGCVQATCLSLMPLNHVMPQGCPFIIQSKIGISLLRASTKASSKLGRQGISSHFSTDDFAEIAFRIVWKFLSDSFVVRFISCWACKFDGMTANKRMANKIVLMFQILLFCETLRCTILDQNKRRCNTRCGGRAMQRKIDMTSRSQCPVHYFSRRLSRTTSSTSA